MLRPFRRSDTPEIMIPVLPDKSNTNLAPTNEKNPLKNGFLFCAGRRVFLSPEIDPCPGIERKIGKIPLFILQIAFRTDHRRIVRTEYFRW